MYYRTSKYRSVRLIAALSLAASMHLNAVERISVSTGNGQSNEQSRYPAISGDGRYVVFNSDASNLVPGDTNTVADIFVRDRVLATTTRVSMKSNGTQSEGPSYMPNIDGDGSRIVFASHGQLLPNAGYQNCYLLDRTAGTLQVLDLRPNGDPATTCDSVSIDYAGTHVSLVSYDGLETGDTDRIDVYVRDLVAGTMRRVSRAPGGGASNGSSTDARISGDGSHVLFASNATNLVTGDSNGETDFFLASSDNSAPIVRANVGPTNVQASAPGFSGWISAINADGSLLAFSSKSPSLPDWGQFAEATLYLRIPSLDQTIALSIPNDNLPRDGSNSEPDFDYSGRWLVFASTDVMYTGAEPGIYVIDLVEGLIDLVSVGGNSGNVHQPRISADGTGIVWYSLSSTQVPGDSNGTWDVFYADNPLWVEPPIFADGFDG
jgi:Tol biopolymer transport system component